MVDLMNYLRQFIYRILFGKEGRAMMAMLWAQQIMLEKTTYDKVPRMLKTQVADILTDSGLSALIVEE